MTIKNKLFTGLGIILIIIGFISTITWIVSNKINKSIVLTSETSKYLAGLQELEIKFHQVLMPPNDYLITGDINEKEQFEKLMKSFKEQFAITYDAFQKHKTKKELPEETSENEFFEHAKKATLKIEEMANKIFSFKILRKDSKEGQLMEEMDHEADEITAQLNLIIEKFKNDIEYIVSDNEKTRKLLLKVVGILSILLLGGFFINTIILIKGINTPLKELVQVTKKIISGDFTSKVKSITNDEIGELAVSFNTLTDEIQRNYHIQTTLNSLLSLSLKDIPIDEILQYTLDQLYSIEWLDLKTKGAAIFTVDNDTDFLIMRVSKNLSEPIQRMCRKLPFGKCLCGLAATTQKVQFADKIDERHSVSYDGIKPHGHYCIPILLDNKTLGVINLYIKEEHKYNQKEVEFLNSIANTLAGIIKRKNTEAEKEKLHIHLVQSDKMAAIGQLAGGVAHEINNPMGVILGFAQSVVKSIKEEDSLYMPLKSIEREAIRCKKLVGDLLTFSRVSKTEAEEIDVNSTIDVALSLVEAQTKVKNIQIIRQYGVDLPKIMANKNQIQQLIINLCNNAIDAMPETGTITISTGNVITSETKQSHIEILVKDTGSGISKEIKNKIFEPFFTTKETGKGTGLGLSLCYEIIKKHNGIIEVDSEIGKGTTFKIIL